MTFSSSGAASKVIKYLGVNDPADWRSFDWVQLGLLRWAHSPLRFLRCTAPGPRTSLLGNANGSSSTHYLCKATWALPKRTLSPRFPKSLRQCSISGPAKCDWWIATLWLLETKHKKETFMYRYWYMYPVTLLASSQPERVPGLLQITQFFKDGAGIQIRLINQNLKLHPTGWEN